MFRWLFLFILIIPALEIGLFVWAGGYIGPWWVIFLIILTGIIGAWLAKQQGLETINKARQSMSMGYAPQEEIFDGLCVILGGILLLTPGFVTDTLGLLLLIPVTRKPIKLWLKKMLQKMISNGKFIMYRR